MSVRVVHVPCGHCGGTGIVDHPRMSQAMNVLAIHHGWLSTAQVAQSMAIGATNAANVLAQLRKLGHVERRVGGYGAYQWRAR